jgi:hypothetical protein
MAAYRMTLNLKHAFLITAYRDEHSLIALFEQILQIKNANIFCQIDQRSESVIQSIRLWLKKNSAIQHRIHLELDQIIHWGSSDHLFAQLRLAKLALQDHADYFHTLTGQCRIITSINTFKNFFDENIGKNFIEHFPLPNSSWARQGGLERICFYQLHDLMDAKKYGKLFLRLNKHFIQLQKLFGINRLKTILESKKPYGGLSYWSLHQDAIKEILNDNLVIKKNFQHTFCSEEIIPQTILNNSAPLKLSLINHSLRFVLWEESHGEVPGIFDMNHLSQLKDKPLDKMPFIFARKFDSVISQELIDQLKNEA